ncbi:MAG: hypothetical protein EPN82_05970 [Bacteroidetes bacterium]|nr:MAG: hypothetical protein EPN82_05970 [Bacteroidota bacterium]
MAEYPCNFRYQSSDQTLHWDGSEGADEYLIEYTPDPLQLDWLVAYSGGNDTQCSFNKPPNTYSAKGKTKEKDKWTGFGPAEIITINP